MKNYFEMSALFWTRLFALKVCFLLLFPFVATSKEGLHIRSAYQRIKPQCVYQEVGSESCVEKCVTELTSWTKWQEIETSDSDSGFNKSLNWWSFGEPELLCREETRIRLSWRPSNLNNSATPPIMYLLELRTIGSAWQCLKTTSRGTETAENLQAATEYKFRLRAVTSAGQMGEEKESEWISTLENNFTPGFVENVNVTQHVTNNRLLAHVAWEPPSDKTCFYDADLVWFTETGDFFTPSFINQTGDVFGVDIDQELDYDQNYTLYMRGKSQDRRRESPNKIVSFVALSCLQANNFSTSLCRPVAPTGVNVSVVDVAEPGLVDITVAWNRPDYEPFSYFVQLLNINSTVNKTVPGNVTFVKFTRVDLFDVVVVKAYNALGFGPAVTLVKQMDSDTHIHRDIPRIVPENYNLSLAFTMFTLAVFALLSAAIMVLYHRYTKRRRYEERCKYFQSLDEKLLLSMSNVGGGVKLPSLLFDDKSLLCDDHWEVPLDQLLQGDVLGEGAFGVVRKGLLQGLHQGELPLIEVAVKMLRDEASVDEMRQFQQEIEMMKSVGRHEHLVSIIGCCTRTTRLMLITEFCALGNLQEYLRSEYDKMAEEKSIKATDSITYAELALTSGSSCSTASLHTDTNPTLVVNQMYEMDRDGGKLFSDVNPSLKSEDLLSFARQTTMGMEYLARNKVVHCDLAARNVLVCSNKNIKISDFGLSRDIYEQNIYRKKCMGKLPIKWMAIESLLHQVYTTQSDVWSFGVLLWEIVTLGSHPYPCTQTDRVFKLLMSGYRMECPENCSAELYGIMLGCWEAKPKDRPTFAQLHAKFDVLLEGSTHDQYLSLDRLLTWQHHLLHHHQ